MSLSLARPLPMASRPCSSWEVLPEMAGPAKDGNTAVPGSARHAEPRARATDMDMTGTHTRGHTQCATHATGAGHSVRTRESRRVSPCPSPPLDQTRCGVTRRGGPNGRSRGGACAVELIVRVKPNDTTRVLTVGNGRLPTAGALGGPNASGPHMRIPPTTCSRHGHSHTRAKDGPPLSNAPPRIEVGLPKTECGGPWLG